MSVLTSSLIALAASASLLLAASAPPEVHLQVDAGTPLRLYIAKRVLVSFGSTRRLAQR